MVLQALPFPSVLVSGSNDPYCAQARARDYIPLYQGLGYQGLFVTDHFFGGNTAVSPRLPWREQVDRFCAGYEEARNEGEKRGFQVLFGWEQAYDKDEYLKLLVEREVKTRADVEYLSIMTGIDLEV